jgi:hypothetical protein
MKFSLTSMGAIALCTLLTSPARANDDASHAAVAAQFVAALQHRHFRDAAALFAPEATRDTAATELVLKRIDDSVGGYSTMHPVAKPLNGPTIKVEVPPRKNVPFKIQKLIQVRYASTARDGKPVYYEVDLTADGKPPQVLAFALHFPAEDAQSKKRAAELISGINR